ncbi:MAG: transporter substrate-binding domain-containing protein [Prevotella sp.]|nr:transporter substrate-binding domain-containing protein [Prevotella sp.]
MRTRKMMYLWAALTLWSICTPSLAASQDENIRVYTREHPLIYEDVFDLWPYSFLNENGEPDGYNVDLIRLMLKELDIPYIIKMKPQQECFKDIKEGKSDLMFALAAGFNDEFGRYSNNTITLFTQSVATPIDKPIEIRTFRDLRQHKVIVWDNSICHHLMKDYGWEENAIPTRFMREAIEKLSMNEDGQIVWNTLSLKWLIQKYQIDNVQITPVDMPHGEYKFMSNNPQLLVRLDSIYTELNSADKFTEIQNKWFYPERNEKKIESWVWYIAGIGSIIIILFLIYAINYRTKERQLLKLTKKYNQRLGLILEASRVRMWTYDTRTNLFTWRNEKGQPSFNYTMEEFSHRYHSGDFEQLRNALQRLGNSQGNQEKEEEVSLYVRAKDSEDGDVQEHDFLMSLSVLRRDKNGVPLIILGTKKDITEERRQHQLDEERTMRYWAIFNTPLTGIMYFDKNGILVNINEKACETYVCNREEMLAEHVSFHDLLDIHIDMSEAEGYHFTQIINLDKIPQEERRVKSCKRKGKLLHEIHLMTVYDDDNQLMGMFAVGRDMTDRVNGIKQRHEQTSRTKDVVNALTEYINNINYVLQFGGVHMVTYSPKSHTLIIYSGINKVQYEITQARCMTLVHDKSKRKAMHLLNNMDNLVPKPIDTDIMTSIHVHDNKLMHLQFNMVPTYDKDGKLRDYFGLCRDVTEQMYNEQQLAQKTKLALEVENIKSSFLKNVSHEIRTPLNTVVGFAELFEMEHSPEDEEVFIQEILKNSDLLLQLINDILFLSRLDAHMIEIHKQPCDFATVFEGFCQQGWERYQREGVNYIVENPYQQLIVDIDATNLQHIIEQVVVNAAQYTQNGTVRARYDYIGRRLMISVEDTGQGISKEILQRIYERFAAGPNKGSGLGLPICKELTEQMGGTLDINSEEGLGTTVWISIPCLATVVKRKKYI